MKVMRVSDQWAWILFMGIELFMSKTNSLRVRIPTMNPT